MKELTILIPCLNEENTIGQVIDEANRFLNENNIDGEIIVSDNGSHDRSLEIIKNRGAKVVNAKEKGYGVAIKEGIEASNGKYIITGDADYSYNMYEIGEVLEKLRCGNDLVIGNRLNKKIEKGAMPIAHRYIGTPIISGVGNIIYKLRVKDYNSGLRGYDREKVKGMNLETKGFEYCTEMIIKAKRNNLKIEEVDINFRKDKRGRKPHLKPIRAGIKHMRVIFENVQYKK